MQLKIPLGEESKPGVWPIFFHEECECRRTRRRIANPLFHARQHRHRHIRYDQHWPQAAVVRFYSVVAKTVLCLSTTWLRVALLHSPASASTVLPGFFMRGRMGGMRFRKLRIAWSVGCGLVCVLLIVLWARSGVH